MNRRLKKKRDVKAISIAKMILEVDGSSYWKNQRRTNWMPGEFWQGLEAREKLLKVCRKCLRDKFPIEHYYMFEIPLQDSEGWIMDFVNMKEYDNAIEKWVNTIDDPEDEERERDFCIHEIDFWCGNKDYLAIPQGIKNGNNYDCKNCFDAVYTE